MKTTTEMQAEIDRLRAERDALREALRRLNDCSAAPTYLQAEFADASTQASELLSQVSK